MRINIRYQKDKIIDVFHMYLKKLYLNEEVEVMLNGDKFTDIITNIVIQKQEGFKYTYLVIDTESETVKLPLIEDSFARFEGECMVLESGKYSLALEPKGKNKD